MTVTALTEPDAEHMVTGLFVEPDSSVRVLLTDEQAEQLGLPAGVGYTVRGTLEDLTGSAVERLGSRPMAVPARWLHPLPDDSGSEP
ncbi:hypothetical protein ACFRMQ_11160 [Kitasatospora sp. NPDC056783]|uniref:hypothetical protein n=1 Tax=Kitasatospora sp. NPDC056783 TaxID=3345943 RepID=UPI0036B09C48